MLSGNRLTVGPGESAVFPRGSAHRWWNEGGEPLEFEGYARPAADLDRYLQAVFEVLNAGPDGRPPLFRVVVAIGTVLGRYRGNDWPGCPSRCLGAPIG